MFQNKEHLKEYLGEHLLSQDQQKLKEYIIQNEKYIKHIAGVCKCYLCTCRHCRCAFSLKPAS